jgi:hypothetical protein
MLETISAVVRTSAFASILYTASIGATVALVLITPQEAALPDSLGPNQRPGFRGVIRGPKVLVVSPAPDAGTVKSPLKLLLKFETHGSAVIVPQLVKVIYLKDPAVNLTPRISDFITTNGIELSGAEVPPGTHYIRIELKDDAGRFGSTVVALMVAE